jgi:hypothetical protein
MREIFQPDRLLPLLRQITTNPRFLELKGSERSYSTPDTSTVFVDGIQGPVPRDIVITAMALARIVVYGEIMINKGALDMTIQDLERVKKEHCLKVLAQEGKFFQLTPNETKTLFEYCIGKLKGQ